MKDNNQENEELQCCEVLNLSKIKKKCKQVIKHCEICEGIIIDNDNVPEEYIVDYNDRQIYSALITCVKCGAKVCENCCTTLDDTWEKIYVCNNCYNKYKKQIKRIQKLQAKADILAEEIAEEIEEFLNES